MKVDTAIGKMQGGGYRVTPQRLAVLRALDEEQHQSMEELLRRCSEIGMATVYRTLDLLSELGLVRRMELGDGSRYELAEDHHHHMICDSCGYISEFEECPVDLNRLLHVSLGFELRSHSVEVYGRCAVCK
jgi:Fur family ferric uptake transcriptional regulator